MPPALIRSVTPRVIEVGVFYEGANVRVEGVAPPGSKVILTVTGSASAETFNRKARYGPIWLTAGKVRISGAPSLFLRFSAEPVRNLLSEDCIAGKDLDEAALMKHVHLEPAHKDPALRAALQADYLALKKSDGTLRFCRFRRLGDGPARERWHSVYPGDSAGPRRPRPESTGSMLLRFAMARWRGRRPWPSRWYRPDFPRGWPSSPKAAPRYTGISAVLISALAGFGIDFLTTHLFRGKRVSH